MSEIYSNQRITCLSKEKRKQAFIDHHRQLMLFMKIWKITIQARKKKVLIVFDDMIADMEPNKKLSAIVTELILRG